MKKLMLLTAVLFLSATSYAQNRPEKGVKNEPFTEAKFEKITKELELKSSDAKKLKPIYKEFVEEVYKIKPIEIGKDATDEQIDEMNRHRLAVGTHISATHEAYYDKFRKVLSAKDVQKMYRVEKQIIEELNSERNRRNNNARPAPREGGNPRR